MKTITTEQLKKKVDAGTLALFDVRGDRDYEENHIPGAKTAPLGSVVFRINGLMRPDSEVVVYSGGGECTLAAQAVQRLENLGMKNVYCYEDGIAGWQRAGFPTVESTKAKVYARGPVVECRPVIVDRKTAYNGIFMGEPTSVESAGG